MKLTLILIFTILFSTVSSAQWVKQAVNTTASLRGLSVVSEKVIWASGTGGTVIKTVDGGKTWRVMTVPGAEKLDFRDVEAFDAKTAYTLSIGKGDESRIYKTVDGGDTWSLQFTNTEPKAFFDAIACWDANNCVAMSDPVNGRYVLISTADGLNWTQPGKDRKSPPIPAIEGEAAFAASGTCLVAAGTTDLFLVSGGSAARVFSSKDRGATWSVAETPFVSGTSGSGIFSLAMRDARNGVIVGGNYEKPEEAGRNLATTSDGGLVWAARSGLSGYRSGVAFIDDRTIIAVGTNGTDISTNQGISWAKAGNENLNSVAARGRKSVWAVGPKGLVVRLN
jgi:photosystem II stability/assembly factor-like uncharacterized protein